MSQNANCKACDCATGLSETTETATGPVGTENPPEKQKLRYRLGVHGTFKDAMILAGARTEGLRRHTSRGDDSAAVAIMDATAVLLDILTFYQERWVNEGYLPTATERLSVLELARSIGYELAPGVAATTHLAFDVDVAPGMSEPVEVPAGVQVQTIPLPGELPQIFETTQALDARPQWSSFAPKKTRPTDWSSAQSQVTVDGVSRNIPIGSKLLFLFQPAESGDPVITEIAAVEEDHNRGVTTYTLTREIPAQSATIPSGYPQVYAFGVEARVFGSTAPDWRTLPTESKEAYLGSTNATIPPEWPDFVIHLPSSIGSRFDLLHFKMDLSSDQVAQAYLGKPVEAKPKKAGSTETEKKFVMSSMEMESGAGDLISAKAMVYTSNYRISTVSLDGEFKSILPNTLALLDDPVGPAVVTISAVETVSRSAFALSGKSTVLTADSKVLEPYRYAVRTLTVLAASKELPLVEEPDPTTLNGSSIRIPDTVPPLPAGRKITLEGFDAQTGAAVSQLLTVKDMTAATDASGWVLELDETLDSNYDRSTAVLRGNVAPASHGESHVEILGHGDARQSWLRMPLAHTPLTFLSSDTDPRGVESTLRVTVDGVRWSEADSFYRTGPQDEIYTLSIGDDGKAYVQFGDGKTGRRLPTGNNNIKASYRAGLGAAGILDAGRLINLISRPLGLRDVHHPVPAAGGDDPESRDDARENAPIPVKTLSRFVSLSDYADFARAYAGVDKAASVWARFGTVQGILLTVAGANGARIEADSDLGVKFLGAMNANRDPAVAVKVVNYQSRIFRAVLKIYYDDRYSGNTIEEAARVSLAARYSFAAMHLGEAVTSAEFLAILHEIPGVVGIDLDFLHFTDRPASRQIRLPATIGRIRKNGTVRSAELITLDTSESGLSIQTIATTVQQLD